MYLCRDTLAFHCEEFTLCPVLLLGVSAVSSSVARFKQRLQDLLDAPRRFHEDCLNDECAFYTSRVTAITHPSVPRCKEPVAKLLDAQDAMVSVETS